MKNISINQKNNEHQFSRFSLITAQPMKEGFLIKAFDNHGKLATISNTPDFYRFLFNSALEMACSSISRIVESNLICFINIKLLTDLFRIEKDIRVCPHYRLCSVNSPSQNVVFLYDGSLEIFLNFLSEESKKYSEEVQSKIAGFILAARSL